MFDKSAANIFQSDLITFLSGLITFQSTLIINRSSTKAFPTTLHRYMSGLKGYRTAIYQNSLLKKSPMNFSLLIAKPKIKITLPNN